MNHLIAIIGPTGVGKSRLAIRLAQAFDGEVVNADSRQIYRHMDIGTAKPDGEQLSLVPHHLIDIINPDEDFSLAQFQQMAYRAINNIQRRHILPLLVGGSGQYIWSVLEGWGIPRVPPDKEMRRRLERRAVEGDKEELYRELEASSPAAAERIDQRNVRRVIRALEVARSKHGHSAGCQPNTPPPYNSLIIGLTTDRAALYQAIDLRVDKMIEQGLVEEVKKLVVMGYGYGLPAMSAIGYKQIGLFLNGELGLEAAVQQMKYEIHRFVRRQYNWFKREDSRIRWFDVKGRIEAEITDLVREFISRKC